MYNKVAGFLILCLAACLVAILGFGVYWSIEEYKLRQEPPLVLSNG